MEQLKSEQFMNRALDRWGDAVYRLALGQTRSTADAQDIVQDTYLKLLKSPVEFEDDEHVKAWLLHVAANRCREHWRSVWTQRVDTLDNADETCIPATDDAVESTLDALDEHPIWNAMARLPEKTRIVMHLYYVEDYPTEVIAEVLGCLPTTVRSRLHRGRKMLKRELDAIEREEGAARTRPLPTADKTPYAHLAQEGAGNGY